MSPMGIFASTIVLLGSVTFLALAWVVVQVLAAGDWLVGVVAAPGDDP